jgi:hypothetical protein
MACCAGSNADIPGSPEYGKKKKPENHAGCCCNGGCSAADEETVTEPTVVRNSLVREDFVNE